MEEFQLNFNDNILSLYQGLKNKTYKHGGYQAFKINDPKPRDIHKASVRDRLVHHAIYRILYPYFDRKFVFDSYSCRINKGTHKAVNRFRDFSRKVSKNNTETCWVLKCDIKKFFANINHDILKNILAKYIADEDVLWIFSQTIDSFNSKSKTGVGLPLGNLTSQLLVNIYMNKFDYFMKREIKAKYYIRYSDDFVIMSEDKKYLKELIPKISKFLEEHLRLSLHPNKLSISVLNSGVDFLGWVNFPYYRILRTSTKKRMLKKLKSGSSEEMVVSYLGLLGHGDTYNLSRKICKIKHK